ncbi:MAG: regulator, partial [Verrucomicrobiota bacterium]
GLDKLGQVGVLYHGLEVLGGGAILSGVILPAIAVFVIDRKFAIGSYFALTGALLTFFGLMHGEKIGIGESPVIACSYVMVALVLAGCAKFAVVAPKPAEEEELHGHLPMATD